MRSLLRGGEFPGLPDVLAHVFVVSHADLDVGVGCLLLHGLEFGDGGRSRFFEVDDGASRGDGFGEETGVVDGAAGDKGEALGVGGDGGEIGDGFVELDSVFGGGFGNRIERVS